MPRGTETLFDLDCAHQSCHTNYFLDNLCLLVALEILPCIHTHTGKPEGDEVLNLHWAVSGSQTHCNKAAIFKSSHKILVIFVLGRCCPGRPHSCFPLHWWTWTCWVDIRFTSLPQLHDLSLMFFSLVVSFNQSIKFSALSFFFMH